MEDKLQTDWLFSSGRQMQLDVFIPDNNLAFEYQGEHHYGDTFRMRSQFYYAARDQEKKNMCMKNGITLIEIPFWWDYKKDSLIKLIFQTRPDLETLK